MLDVSHSVKRKTNKQTATDGGLVVEASSGGAPIVDYGPLRLDWMVLVSGFCIPIVVAALFMLRSVPAWITNTHTHNSSSSEAVAAAQRTIESPRPRDGASTSCVPMYVVPQKRVQRYEYLLRIGRFSGIAMHI